jgi:hypothetical protein
MHSNGSDALHIIYEQVARIRYASLFDETKRDFKTKLQT